MKTLPEQIDFTKLAEHQAHLVGSVPLTPMSRLTELVANTEAEVEIDAHFNHDLQHKAFVDLKINTCLVLQCQRCLENFDFPVSVQVLLAPTYSNEEAQALQSYEPLMTTKGELVNLSNMIEDEILLNLPLVAKHPKNVCPVVLSPSETKPESPFAVLSKLKIKKEE